MTLLLILAIDSCDTVSWDDQSAINTFSKLVNRLANREEDLRTKKQDQEYLEDLENELELADEDELIPYRIGDAFIHLSLESVQARIETEKSQVEGEVDSLETELDSIKDEMAKLKIKLKSKFGESINLDS